MAVQIQVRSDSRQAQVDLKKLEASLNSVQASATSINRSISGLATATKVAFAALPIAAIGTAALRTAASFETLNARLVTATGNAQKATSAFIAVQKIVTRTPYSVRTLTDAYARLATTGSRIFASQSQIERGIQNIADSVAAVGGGNVELERVARAFERMAGEGRITAERLNQITDAGIPLTKIAKALGVSMEELRAESEKGALTFARFYKAFQQVAEAADGFGGAASRQVNTLSGAMSNLNDAFDILADRAVRQSGISQILIKNIVGVTDSINDFSKGIEVDIAVALYEIAAFYYDATKIFKDIGKVIYGLGEKTVSLIPTFNIDPAELKASIKASFDSIDFRGMITNYKLKLGDFLPGLDDVKASISKFGQYVKDVFYSIWDTVVGNSTWPDLIKGVTEWASKLEGMVKPHLDKFKVFVLNLFTEIKAKFNEITSKVAFEFNVSADTSALSKVSTYLAQINTNISKVIDSAKQHPTVGKFSTKLEEVTTTIIESYKQLSQTSGFQTLKGVFNGISIILADSLIPRLIAVYGAVAAFMNIDPNKLKLELTATLDKLKLSNSLDKGIAEKTREELDKFAKDLDQSIKTFKDKASKGVTGFETTEKVIGAQGDLLGKIIGDAFGTGVKNAEYTMTEILTGVVALAFSSSLRALVGTAVVVKLVFGEQSFSESLSKIYDLISKFGNNVLKGAGVPGYASETGVGGFIAGLLFGGLALATITGKLVPILTNVAKLIGAYFIVPRLFEGKEANQAANGAETFGQKTGRRLQTGMRAGFSAAGGIAALLAAEKFSDFFEIEDKLNRAFVEIGFSIGGAMAGAMIGGFLASSLIKGGAWVAMAFSLPVIKAALTRLALSTVLLGAIFPSVAGITTAVGGMLATLAAALSGPVLLAALGVAAGGFLLYNIFFGEEGGWGSKIKKLFKEQIGPAIESFFTGIFSWMEVKITELGNSIKKFFTFGGKPSDGSQSGGLTVDPTLGLASGGKVAGPGTGTSDSILARLSNGEYVVNAKATSKNRGLLERINNGLPAFKDGTPSLGKSLSYEDVFIKGPNVRSSGLNPNFKEQLTKLGNDFFEQTGNKVRINSAYRSNEYQKELFDLAIKKYGSKAKARKWVAEPTPPLGNGRGSNHLYGLAVDLQTNGRNGIGKIAGRVSKGTDTGWLANYGLTRPIKREDWHVEPFSAKDLRIDADSWLPGYANGGYVNDQDFNMVGSYVRQFMGNVDDNYINSLLKQYKQTGQLEGHLNTLRMMTGGYANGGYVNDQDFDMVGSYIRQFMGNVDDGYINSLLKQYKQTGQLEGHLNTLRMMTGGYANGGYVNDQDFDMVGKYIRSFVGNVDDSYINNVLKQYKQTGQLEGHLSVIRNMTDSYASGGSISGPGTGTSDSILARLSNGEYVVNAKATKMNRSLLERINSGLPAFAQGGSVGSLAAQAGIDISKLDLDKATRLEIIKLKEELGKLLKVQKDYNNSEPARQEELKERLAKVRETVEAQLQPFQKPSLEALQAIRDEARENFTKRTGDASATSVRGDFNTGLSSLLKGQSNIGDFGDTLLNSITGNIVDSFSAGITEGIFGKEGLNLESMFSGLFGGQAGIGFDLFGGSKVKPIGAEPTGRAGDPIYTAPDPMAGITLPPAGNNPDEAAVGQKSIFGDFTTKVQEIFDEGVDGFRGAFTDLGGTFTKLFSGFGKSIMSLFSGGGGGGLGGLGSLFSSFSGLFSMGSSPASMLAGGMIPMDTGGVVPGQLSGQPFPIMAHAGEIILNEAQQSRVAAAMQSRDNSSQQQVNINITGDISRQTRQEILTMSPQIAEMVRNNFIEKRVLK